MKIISRDYISKTWLVRSVGSGFVLGVFIAPYFVIPDTLNTIIIITSISYAIIFCRFGKFYSKKQFVLSVSALCFLFLFGTACGVWRYSIHVEHMEHGNIARFIADGERHLVSFTGVVVDEPDVRTDKVKYTIGHIISKDISERISEKEKTLITLPLYPRFTYGDELSVKCPLEKAGMIEDFDYYHFLMRHNITGVCYIVRSVKKINEGKGSFLYSNILKVKKILIIELTSRLIEPHASLAAGILWGAKQGIPDDVSETFRRVGITHIVAVSGYNITIIGVAFLAILPYFGVHRKYALWLVMLGIIFYVCITGAQASVIRAAVMGVIALIAKYGGRSVYPFMLLICSAFLMLAMNPFIIYDMGFHLSFLATIGLIYLSPYVIKVCGWVPEMFGIRESFVSTLSATIATLPITVYAFKGISLIAPIVNLLVLPVIPYAMLTGFFTIIFGSVFGTVGALNGWLTWLFLEYVIRVAEAFAAIPYAYVSF